jgi:NADPH:quinone reductase-like Zn-dependent oxidoreductase
MKAANRAKYGPPEVIKIEEIAKPMPKDNEILVRVHATTVNRTDCALLTGKPFAMQFFTGLGTPNTLTLGTDFAGIIEEIGKKITEFKVGDKVLGFRDQGLESQAQYVAVNPSKRAVVKMPENISFAQAVASAEGAHYAYNFIHALDLKAGQKVLVNGATGAVGSAAVQILKSMGIYVVAVCDTKNIARVSAMKANEVIDYLKEDFTKINEKFEFVFDAVGKSTFNKCKPILKSEGIYISSELGPNAENLYLPLITKIKGGKRVIFPIPSDCKRSLLFMQNLLAKGQFDPLIDRTYPLEKINEAYTHAASGQKIGNIIITYE